jgi:hypothetical protein
MFWVGSDLASVLNDMLYCHVNQHLLVMDKKNQLDVTSVFFISLLLVAQHVSGNHVPITRR